MKYHLRTSAGFGLNQRSPYDGPRGRAHEAGIKAFLGRLHLERMLGGGHSLRMRRRGCPRG